jgi:hypothetical protein
VIGSTQSVVDAEKTGQRQLDVVAYIQRPKDLDLVGWLFQTEDHGSFECSNEFDSWMGIRYVDGMLFARMK